MRPAGARRSAAASNPSGCLASARSAEALADTQIMSGAGQMFRLREIADVHDGVAEVRSLARLNGRPATAFGIFKAKGASDVSVFRAAQAELDKIGAEKPDVQMTMTFTTVDHTLRSYDASLSALVEGSILAVIVVWLFLRNGRATLISALAIPLSAVPTFAFMQWMDFTLNQITLLALSLVAGVLVDDAIVEIENIVRHMRMGKSAYRAAMDAADEIGLAVVATSFTIIAVFLPVSFMGGITGQYFRQFGLTVAVSVFMSLLVARLITPVLAAYFLRRDAMDMARHPDGPFMRQYLSMLALVRGEPLEDGGRRPGVLRAVHPGHDHHSPGIRAAGGLRQLAVECRGAAGARSRTRRGCPPPRRPCCRKSPDVVRHQRIRRRHHGRDPGRHDVREPGAAVPALPEPEAVGAVHDAAARPGAGRASGLFQRRRRRDVEFYMVGDDPRLVERTAQQAVAEMQTLSELRAPRIKGDLPRPEIVVKPRLDMAAQLGVSVQSISQTIRIATLGDLPQNGAKFSLSDRQIPIRVSLTESARRDLATLENLPVPTASGTAVPLKTVADLSFGQGPSVVRRYNQSRRFRLGADLAPGVELGTATKKIDRLPIMKHLPQGVRRCRSATREFFQEMMRNFALAIGAGVLMVLAVLVLLFARLFQPITILSALPLVDRRNRAGAAAHQPAVLDCPWSSAC